MSATPDNLNLRRACRYLRALAGHEFGGLRPKQIAEAVGASPSTVSRDLRVLLDEGIVEHVPGMEDRWRLGPKVVQIALAHTQGVERVSSRLDEVKQRYSREP